MGYFLYLILFFPLRHILYKILREIGQFIPPIRVVAEKLDQVSTVFHELCHYAIDKILLFPVSLSDISFTDDFGGGSVKMNYNTKTYYRFSLMKIILSCIAPLLVGTWVVLTLAGYWTGATLMEKVGICLAIGSLILGLQPSKQDFRCIWKFGVTKRPWLALRQFLCAILAALIYLWQADYFMWWHPTLPILFEIVVMLGIFAVLDLLCYIIDELRRIVMRCQLRSQFGYRRHSRKYKIPLFAKPVPTRRRIISRNLEKLP